jgi:pilus assembly protein CpaB
MLVLVAAALLIAGVTAVLIRNLLTQQQPVVAAAPQQTVPTEKVLVAARDVAQGAVLIEEDVRYEEWPQTLIDKRYIVKTPGEDPKGRILGSIAGRKVQAGEPLTGSAVFRQDEAGQMSAMIGPGMRAVSLPISGMTSVSGFVLPGDHVDVLLVTSYKDKRKRARYGEEDDSIDTTLHVSEIFLRDVRVIAVDKNFHAAGAAQDGHSATIEVTPKDAERVILAGIDGTFHLVLRSQIAGDTMETDELNYDVMASRALQTYSPWPAKLGMMNKKPEPVPEQPTFDESAAGRNVKVNRAGVIETRIFH